MIVFGVVGTDVDVSDVDATEVVVADIGVTDIGLTDAGLACYVADVIGVSVADFNMTDMDNIMTKLVGVKLMRPTLT